MRSEEFDKMKRSSVINYDIPDQYVDLERVRQVWKPYFFECLSKGVLGKEIGILRSSDSIDQLESSLVLLLSSRDAEIALPESRPQNCYKRYKNNEVEESNLENNFDNVVRLIEGG